MAHWKKPSRLEVETNDEKATIEHCESLGWKRANGQKPQAEAVAPPVGTPEEPQAEAIAPPVEPSEEPQAEEPRRRRLPAG